MNVSVLVVWTVLHGIQNLVALVPNHFEIQPADAYVLPHTRSTLKHLLRGRVPQYHDAVVVREIAFAEIAAICEVQLAHLPIGHFHSAHLDRPPARPQLHWKLPTSSRPPSPPHCPFSANRLKSRRS